MQGDKKFLAVMDKIMHVPFRIGSDGTTCWFVRSDVRVALPSREIDEKNVLFVDPFDARAAVSVERIIRDRKLEYAGAVDLNGRRCHLIRSWEISLLTDLSVILGPDGTPTKRRYS